MTRWTSWQARLGFTDQDIKILVMDSDCDLLKAQFPSPPCHPRALMTLLEGLALWQGHPLCAVASASDASAACFEAAIYGDGLVAPESPLVHLEIQHPSRSRRLRGVGDFRQLRLRGRQR